MPPEVRAAASAAVPLPMRRPRLLFLCQTLPFPPDGGVQIRTYNVMRLLAREFDITALCFFRRATRPTAEDRASGVAGLGELARTELFPIPQESSRLRAAWDHLRSLVSGRVYTRYVYESSEYRLRLRQLLADTEFDLVHVDSLDLSPYLPDLPGIPVVCTHHNVESDLLERRAAVERSAPRRWYLRHQASLMRAEERAWCGRVSLNLAVSHADAERLRRIAPGARVSVVPNGVDSTAFMPDPDATQDGVVFVGGHSWYPNRDAMTHFIDDILPTLRRLQPDVRVTWVGRAPRDRAYYDRNGVQLTGYVPDIRPFVQGAACYIVPLRMGGGTRLKILDAWAMGKAVVSTSVGCEGLEARDGENILVRDDPAAFATAVRDLLRDESLRRRIGQAARRTAEYVYDWEVVGRAMREEYLSLGAGAAEAVAADHGRMK